MKKSRFIGAGSGDIQGGGSGGIGGGSSNIPNGDGITPDPSDT